MTINNLNCIVEVSLKGTAGLHDIGIMTVRQALNLPRVPRVEYSHRELNGRGDGRHLTSDELKHHVCN